MARIHLDIEEPLHLITLRAMLEVEGHQIEPVNVDLVIADDPLRAVKHAGAQPTLVLVQVNAVPEAIEAMRQGVYGYILLPFQPGEASIMVQRALESAGQPVTTPGEEPLQTLAEAEQELIRRTMRRCKNNQTEAARLLGIGRNTLWRKLKGMP